jgi:Restriction endonuclease
MKLAKDTTQKGTEFETQIAALYRSAGFDITQNYSVSGTDFDLLCRKEIAPQIVVSIAIECKFKSGREKVGPLDLEKFSNKFQYAKGFGITHGVIVCNNGFTPTAHIAAQKSNITLRSSTELEDDLLGLPLTAEAWNE